MRLFEGATCRTGLRQETKSAHTAPSTSLQHKQRINSTSAVRQATATTTRTRTTSTRRTTNYKQQQLLLPHSFKRCSPVSEAFHGDRLLLFLRLYIASCLTKQQFTTQPPKTHAVVSVWGTAARKKQTHHVQNGRDTEKNNTKQQVTKWTTLQTRPICVCSVLLFSAIFYAYEGLAQ